MLIGYCRGSKFSGLFLGISILQLFFSFLTCFSPTATLVACSQRAILRQLFLERPQRVTPTRATACKQSSDILEALLPGFAWLFKGMQKAVRESLNVHFFFPSPRPTTSFSHSFSFSLPSGLFNILSLYSPLSNRSMLT